MKQKYFRVPFAQNGDKQSIVENSDSHGYVNYNDGFGPDYEKDLATDAQAKPPERNTFNELFNCITENVKQYQENGFPEFITAADNGGISFAYSRLAIVNYNNELYISLVDNNTVLPGTDETKWQPYLTERADKQKAIEGADNESIITPLLLQTFIEANISPYTLPVGAVIAWGAETPPNGFLECNGQFFDTAKYPELAKVYPKGFVPDLRGRFIRGWANGSIDDADVDREIGSFQPEMLTAHKHVSGWGEISGGYFGKTTSRGYHGSGKNDHDNYLFHTNDGTDYSGVVNPSGLIGAETRPKNIALMYIVKTDFGESSSSVTVPTNLILSPKSINAGVNTKQQLTAMVIPSSIAPNYPVSFHSSDDDVCTVSDTGLVELTGAGAATIVASISTGIATVVEVTSNILLTSLQMASIPNMTAGETYSVLFTATPANYTETVLFNTSDQSVASINGAGEITANNAGSCTISITGQISGITISKTLTVQSAQVVETYLQIDNNLSDLKDVFAARNNLGLKTLATKDSLSPNDVGAVPLIEDAIQAGTNLNTIVEAGQYYQNITSNATIELNYPVAVAGALTVYKTGVDEGCRQEYMPYNSTKVYRRYAFGSPLNFSAWDEY